MRLGQRFDGESQPYSLILTPTISITRAYHLLLWLTEKAGPSGVKRGTRLPQRETPCLVAASHRPPVFLSLVPGSPVRPMHAPRTEFVAAQG